jgi:hypothetical protein
LENYDLIASIKDMRLLITRLLVVIINYQWVSQKVEYKPMGESPKDRVKKPARH